MPSQGFEPTNYFSSLRVVCLLLSPKVLPEPLATSQYPRGPYSGGQQATLAWTFPRPVHLVV